MAKFKDYEDELRDFSLLVNNQFILTLVMKSIPIFSYKLEIFTEAVLAKGHAFSTDIVIRVNDGRFFSLHIETTEDDSEYFKLIFILTYLTKVIIPENTLTDEDIETFKLSQNPAIFDPLFPNSPEHPVEYASEEKIFYFIPTMSQAEAIVNEAFIWLKEQIALLVSGVN